MSYDLYLWGICSTHELSKSPGGRGQYCSASVCVKILRFSTKIYPPPLYIWLFFLPMPPCKKWIRVGGGGEKYIYLAFFLSMLPCTAPL